jgi:hypothetical protein
MRIELAGGLPVGTAHHPGLAKNPNPIWNRRLPPSLGAEDQKGTNMLGKIAAAIIGGRMAGRNQGASGAVEGILVETVAKKLIPTIAAAAILGYAYKKAKDFLEDEGEPSYPSEASPAPPSS